MAYNALDVARYIQIYLHNHGEGLSNLKMQKILYYVQAGFLVETGDVCFDDKIICWKHGPVVKSVYNEFSKYGAEDIPNQEHYLGVIFKNGKFQVESLKFDMNKIFLDARIRINKIVDSLIKYGPWFLVDRTHEESPWKDKKDYNLEITPSEIKEYFMKGKNKERIYGRFA